MRRVVLAASISATLCLAVIACSEDPEPASGGGEATSTSATEDPREGTPEAEGSPEGEGATEGEGSAGGEGNAEGEGPAEPVESQADLECESEDVTCPLFDWMEENVKPAVEDRDVEAVGKALHRIEFLSPDPAWNEGENGWAQIARRGALAAEAGDLREARRACKACHKLLPEEAGSYRDLFRERHRLAPVPELPDDADQGMPNLDMGEGG
jgi:hypothetical protein